MNLRRLLLVAALLGFSTILRAAPAPGDVRGTGPDGDPTRQTDADWVDDRWQHTDIGRFLCNTVEIPGRRTPKGIVIKVGEHDEGAVCFDEDLVTYSAGWLGGFVKLHPKRYGLLVAPEPDGDLRFKGKAAPGWAHDGKLDDPRPRKLGPLPKDWAHFEGFYTHGKRVVISYRIGATEVLDSPWLETRDGISAFTRTLDLAAHDGELILLAATLAKGKSSLAIMDGVSLGVIEDKSGVLAVGLVGAAGERVLGAVGDSLLVSFAPSKTATQEKVITWSGAKADLPKFAALVKASAKPEPLAPLTKGGPAHWTQPVETKGVIGRELGPFQVDTLTVPYDNPWKALMFTSGHDFFQNGDAAVCTAHGDVWVVSGIDDKLAKLSWKRFATGLYQPLGLKVVDDRVFVLCRDMIVEPRDLNGDGEADHYRNFNHDAEITGRGHSFATSLETDPAGNFWYMRCAEETPHGGTIQRVSKDGSTLEVIATGFRNPNGMGMSPDGIVTAADQQGNWVPETRLDVIKPGGFYGFVPMSKQPLQPTDYDKPLLWIPRVLDNSAGGQAWVPAKHWGPLAGQMLHLSYGRCTLLAVLRDTANDHAQGGVVSLPTPRFLSGVMRARFSPRDGALYLSGLRGWQTAALKDGCFQRVRYTGKPLHLPVAFTVKPGELHLTFAEAVDQEIAADVGSYAAEMWNYRWSEKYGSPDFSVRNPGQEGRDELTVKSARVLADGRTVALAIPDLQPAMQLALQYNLDSADGKVMQGTFYTTVNQIGR